MNHEQLQGLAAGVALTVAFFAGGAQDTRLDLRSQAVSKLTICDPETGKPAIVLDGKNGGSVVLSGWEDGTAAMKLSTSFIGEPILLINDRKGRKALELGSEQDPMQPYVRFFNDGNLSASIFVSADGNMSITAPGRENGLFMRR